MQWSGKLLQNIILLLSEAVNDWRIGIDEWSLASAILSIANTPLWNSVMQWSGKLLQNIIVFLLSEAVNECDNCSKVLISIWSTFNSQFTIVELIIHHRQT